MTLTLRPATRMDNAIQAGLSLPNSTHMFLISDGEPNRGVTDHAALRQMARSLNTRKILIITLALGLGETWPGMELQANSFGQSRPIQLRKSSPLTR